VSCKQKHGLKILLESACLQVGPEITCLTEHAQGEATQKFTGPLDCFASLQCSFAVLILLCMACRYPQFCAADAHPECKWPKPRRRARTRCERL